MTASTDGDFQFVLVGVAHHCHNVLRGARLKDGRGHAMKHVALIRGDCTAGFLIQEHRAIKLRQAIKRARCCILRNPRTLLGIETNNGSANGEPGEVPARDLVFHCELLTGASEKRCGIIGF